jgi:hypothetical protein
MWMFNVHCPTLDRANTRLCHKSVCCLLHGDIGSVVLIVYSRQLFANCGLWTKVKSSGSQGSLNSLGSNMILKHSQTVRNSMQAFVTSLWSFGENPDVQGRSLLPRQWIHVLPSRPISRRWRGPDGQLVEPGPIRRQHRVPSHRPTLICHV